MVNRGEKRSLEEGKGCIISEIVSKVIIIPASQFFSL